MTNIERLGTRATLENATLHGTRFAPSTVLGQSLGVSIEAGTGHAILFRK